MARVNAQAVLDQIERAAASEPLASGNGAVTHAETVDRSGRRRRGSKQRAAEEGERMAIYLPPDLHEAVRELAFRERASLSYVVTMALDAWVKRVTKGRP